MTETLALILGYALGSIPFGLVVTKFMGLGSLRSVGSGNIGATNVLRTGNKVAVTRMELRNDEDVLLAVGTGTYLIG